MTDEKIVYLDHAASSPMRDEARAAIAAYEASSYAGANPNSLHSLGRQAARALDGARATIAHCLGGGFRPADVTFTSGGTESNNLAIIGIAEGVRGADRTRNTVVLSAIEHDSILDLVPMLHDRGFEVRLAKANRAGIVTPEALDEVLDRSCALASIMSANNETGVVQPVGELSRAAKAVGAAFHTDAIQAFGRIPLQVADVDAVSIAAHKIGGPVGIGALALRGRTKLRPLMLGGGQELGRRPGTQDVSGALAFAAASKWCCDHMDENRSTTARRAEALFSRLCADGTGIVPTTTAMVGDDRLPGLVSVLVPSLDSETLILKLDQRGFEVSAGSACSSESLDPSHVLSAMGIARREAQGALRISFDERASEEDLVRFSDTLIDIVRTTR